MPMVTHLLLCLVILDLHAVLSAALLLMLLTLLVVVVVLVVVRCRPEA